MDLKLSDNNLYDGEDTFQYAGIVSPKQSDILNSQAMSASKPTFGTGRSCSMGENGLDIGNIYTTSDDESLTTTPFKKSDTHASGRTVSDLYDIHNRNDSNNEFSENPASNTLLLRGVSNMGAFQEVEQRQRQNSNSNSNNPEFAFVNPLRSKEKDSRPSVGGELYELYNESSATEEVGAVNGMARKMSSNLKEFVDNEEEDEYLLDVNVVTVSTKDENHNHTPGAAETPSVPPPRCKSDEEASFIRDLWQQNLDAHQQNQNRSNNNNNSNNDDPANILPSVVDMTDTELDEPTLLFCGLGSPLSSKSTCVIA